MLLTPTDYAMLIAACAGSVFGLFIGLSGALAFLSGTFAAVSCGFLGWQYLSVLIATPGWCALATVVASFLAFGLVRLLVRRFVRVLIAQPADAIFGAMAAGISTLAFALGMAWLVDFAGFLPYPSTLLDAVVAYVR